MVMSTVSPFLLGIRPIRSLVVKNLRAFHFLALTGLLAYLVHNPVYRLFTVGFALWISCLAWAATWYSEGLQAARLESKISAWLIGLVASSVVKFAHHTNNPIWPTSHAANGGLNGIGLILGILAVLRSTRKTPIIGSRPGSERTKGGLVRPRITWSCGYLLWPALAIVRLQHHDSVGLGRIPNPEDRSPYPMAQ